MAHAATLSNNIMQSISILERVISAISFQDPNSPATQDDKRIFARYVSRPVKDNAKSLVIPREKGTGLAFEQVLISHF